MIFIDTGAFLGRYLKNDQFHESAVGFWRRLGELGTPLLVSNFVLDETMTLLARRASYGFASERARTIYASPAFDILRPTAKDELEALRYFRKYADQRVSFTDCISFVLMRNAGIREAFTFDKHFRVAGFGVRPGPEWAHEPR